MCSIFAIIKWNLFMFRLFICALYSAWKCIFFITYYLKYKETIRSFIAIRFFVYAKMNKIIKFI